LLVDCMPEVGTPLILYSIQKYTPVDSFRGLAEQLSNAAD
jgi:hypothetical protein